MKQFWVIALVFLFMTQISFGQFKPSVIVVESIPTPVKFEDCFIQLDTILNDSFLSEIKNLPIDIATIKLEYNIGFFLENKWKLDYYSDFNGELTYRKYRPEFMQTFFDNDVSEPYIILRIIFRCFHNHLNNLPIDIANETLYYKKLTGLNSLKIRNHKESFHIRDIVKRCEEKLIENYQLSFFGVGDTLGFNVSNHACGINCLLTGKLIDMDTINNIAHLYIYDIACSNRSSSVSDESTLIELYDTVTCDLKRCFKLNYKYPTSSTVNTQQWNRYVNEKYSK